MCLLIVPQYPLGKPVGQGTDFPKGCEPLIDGVVISPHYVSKFAISYTSFDVVAIKPQIALHIKTVGATRHRAMKIDGTGAGRQVQQRTSDGAGQGLLGHAFCNFFELFRCQFRQPLAQQVPFRDGELRDAGELPAASVASFFTLPVGAVSQDGLHAIVYVDMELG